MEPYSPAAFWLATATTLALVLAVPVALLRGRRRLLASHAREDRWGIAAATLAAALVRIFAVQPTAFAENGHGCRFIGMAIDPASDLHVYGSAYQAFFGLLYRFAPPTSAPLLHANIALGALTCAAAGLFASRVFGRGAGALAAAAVAFTPVLVRMSATESPFVLGGLLLTLGLWATAEARLRGDVVAGLVAVLALALAPQVRPFLAMAPLLGAALFFALPSPRAAGVLRRPGPWLAHLGGAALLVPHAIFFYGVHFAGDGSHYADFVNLEPAVVLETLRRGVLVDPRATPPLFWAAATIGVGAQLRRHPRAALVPLLALLAATWVWGSRTEHFTMATRFATIPSLLLAIWAGVGLRDLAAAITRVAQGNRAPAGAILVLLFATVPYSTRPTRAHTVEMAEHDSIAALWPHYPDGCQLLLPPRRMGPGRVEMWFPNYELAYRVPGLDPDVSPFLFDIADAAPDGCVVYYRSTACALFAWDEEPQALRPECGALEAQIGAHTIAVTSAFDGRYFERHFFQPAPLAVDLGLYRVTRRPGASEGRGDERQ
jgi:hypothetical protein